MARIEMIRSSRDLESSVTVFNVQTTRSRHHGRHMKSLLQNVIFNPFRLKSSGNAASLSVAKRRSCVSLSLRSPFIFFEGISKGRRLYAIIQAGTEGSTKKPAAVSASKEKKLDAHRLKATVAETPTAATKDKIRIGINGIPYQTSILSSLQALEELAVL